MRGYDARLGVVSIRQVSSETVYRNAWMSVREDQVEYVDGTPGVYSVLDRDDYALVIPADGDGFHLVEQYRYPVGARSWEFPSGSFPPGVTGEVETMAAAELREETGFTAATWTRLGHLHVANGTTGQVAHVFLAEDLVPGEPDREPAEQDMVQRWFPRTQVEAMIRDGVVTDGPSVAAYLLLTLSAPR